MMKRSHALIGLLLMFVLVMGASATPTLQSRLVSLESWNPQPTELDTEYPDSIVYHNLQNQYFYGTGGNYYIGVRFTPPSMFELQALRVYIKDAANLETLPVSIYSNSGGQPDELLFEMWDAEPTYLVDDPNFQNDAWAELALDPEDYMTWEEGEDYWVVIGLCPGFGNGSWGPVLDADGAVPGERSKWGSSPTDLNYGAAPYDWVVNALGEYAGNFFDVEATTLYNDIQQFHMLTETDVLFTARFTNNGTTSSPEGQVTFDVTNEDNDVVFTETVDLPELAAFDADTVDVSTTTAWTPDENGRYIANVTAELEGEGEISNNSYQLLQNVIEVNDWQRYDDDSYEATIGTQLDNGWAVGFFPLEYPGRIDSVSFFFASDQEESDLRVWTETANGEEQVWQYTGPVVEGWNDFLVENEAYPDGININDGLFFVGWVDTGGDYSWYMDTNPPISGLNDHMPMVSAAVQAGVLYIDNSGNWMVRAKLGAGVASELFFPSTTVTFDTTEVGDVSYAYLHVLNNGTAVGRIDSIAVGAPIIDVVSIETAMPLDVLPGEEDSVQIAWGPMEEGTMTGGLLVYVNEPQFPNGWQTVILSGVAVTNSVEEVGGVPAEYYLAQNYPNPFNPTTEIRFGLKQPGHVRLTVYNLMGQEVATLVDAPMTAAQHVVRFDARDLASGIYYYSIEVNNFHSLRKMVLVR